MGYRLIWIAVWAATAALIFGFGARKWSDRMGPYEIEDSFSLPVSDYEVTSPELVSALPELMADFLMKHSRVDWLPLIKDDENQLLHRALSGMAESGDGEAALLGGLMLLRDQGLDGDAVQWLAKGAELGDAHAQLLLAEVVLVDGFDDFDSEKALAYLNEAASSKIPSAMVLMAVAHQQEGRPVMAEKMVSEAANLGDREALYHSALFNWNAVGRKPDEKGMVVSLMAAAEQGDRRAMHALGQCYESGLGVASSFREARRWNQLAASHGYLPAQHWCQARGL